MRSTRAWRSGSPAITTPSESGASGLSRNQSTKAKLSSAKLVCVPKRFGSITMVNMQLITARRPSASLCHVPPPLNAPPSNSQATAKPKPLCSPKVRNAPILPLLCGTTTTPGLLVGLPCSSINVPGSTSRPSLCATRILPWATRLVAKSRTKGSLAFAPYPIGIPIQQGLVPKRPSPPPNGATTGRDATLTKCSDTHPLATAISA